MSVGAGFRRWRYRMPLRQQLTQTECGAACLAMVLAYYGRDLPVTEVREKVAPGRDGSSVRQLMATAQAEGLVAEARGVPEVGTDFRGPAIAHVDGGHFVVVEKANQRWVRLADPAVGRYWQPRQEFAERYSGTLLLLRPGPGFEPRRQRLRDHALLQYLRDFVLAARTKGLLVKIIMLAAMLQLVALVMPLATKLVVDHLIPQGRLDLVPMLGIAVVGVAVLHAGLNAMRGLLMVTLRVRADALLTSRFVNHLTALPLSFYLQRSRGDLLTRLGGISVTRESITQQAMTMVLDIALLSAYSIGLAVFAPAYLPVVAAVAAAQIAMVMATYGPVRRLAQREMAAKAEEQGYLVEMLEGMVSIKANGAGDRVSNHWRGLFDAFQTHMRRMGRFSAYVNGMHSGFGTLTPLLLLWFGMWLVLRGDLTLGTMLAANALASSLLNPVAALVGIGQLFAQLRAQLDRIYDVFRSSPEPSGSRVPSEQQPAHVQIENLTFRYQPDAAPVLKDVDLEVLPGGKVGIVGPTGAGKTTLALLILGLLPANEGTIRYNGTPLEEWDLSRLRQGFGVVLQDLTLFNGTIADNLRLARPDASDDEVHEAARIAGIHDDIGAFPMGYQTRVGEGGAALSAGQRQRIALGRAVVQRPRLLVLDEATSHLDPVTERRVNEALTGLVISRVVISHRLSAVQDADEIYVVRHGQIVERGSHHQLLAKGGLYTNMFGQAASGDALVAQASPSA